jgi:hypothetical protein
VAEDANNLIGGHATSTLDDAERRLLYSAALEDQRLFDQLMDEEPLRELWEDPRERARLRQHLQDAGRVRSWAWFTSRAGLAWTTGLAAVLVIGLTVIRVWPTGSPSLVRETATGPVSNLATPSAQTEGSPSDVARVAAAPDVRIDPTALSWTSAVPDFMGPARKKELPQGAARNVIRFIPPRDGRGIVIAVTASGEAGKLYPPGDGSWARFQAGVPVEVDAPDRLRGQAISEIRVALVQGNPETRDLGALMAQGLVVTYALRQRSPNQF